MSAANRGTRKGSIDYYATPAWAVAAILPHLDPGSHEPVILDPGCGDGAILRGAGARWPDAVLRGFDVVDRGCPGVEIRDALTPETWGAPNLIVANPPYSLAMEFLERALVEADGGEVAFLLRLSWMAGRRRAVFHRLHPSDVYVLAKRPSFTGGGSDACDYAWFVSGPKRGGRWAILDGSVAPLPEPVVENIDRRQLSLLGGKCP